MREVLTVHEPLLVNTLGHLTGTLIFAIFLVLLLRDRAGSRGLTFTAAGLAFVWNFASLLVIAWDAPGKPVSEVLVSISTVALSLLPAVLLDLSLGQRFTWIRRCGYTVALLTAGIHASEMLLQAQELHQVALRITSFGFGALTLITVALERRFTSRLVGAMALFLFSVSFVHLGAAQPHAWPVELFAHHAGIALALFVLLQDHRFLLLDAFARFLANILFAAIFLFAAVTLWNPRQALVWASDNTFREGVLLASACFLLLLFSLLRGYLSHLLTVLVFPRNNIDTLLHDLRAHALQCENETTFLDFTAVRVAAFFDAEPGGSEAVVPVTPTTRIALGRRRGGRRYLSEDLEAISRIQIEIGNLLEQLREKELKQLVASAELRALQAQIHPHFLFNALNTLYGIIPREASGARKTVLNLADIFRYFLETERTYIPLADELEIVRAYLEIESLRLGAKLRTEVKADEAALRVPIPVLTVEPLVENAVKHGVAANSDGGTVRVTATVRDGMLRIVVRDTGPGFAASAQSRSGVGLENVARRLRMCYGVDSELHIDSTSAGTTVEFRVPAHQPEAALR